MKRRNYRLDHEDQWLPSGFVTKDMRRYTRAWRKLIGGLERFFDRDCIGCNPGILFDGNNVEGTRLEAGAAIKIWELLNKKEWKD
jgi:hypothetical protein